MSIGHFVRKFHEDTCRKCEIHRIRRKICIHNSLFNDGTTDTRVLFVFCKIKVHLDRLRQEHTVSVVMKTICLLYEVIVTLLTIPIKVNMINHLTHIEICIGIKKYVE